MSGRLYFQIWCLLHRQHSGSTAYLLKLPVRTVRLTIVPNCRELGSIDQPNIEITGVDTSKRIIDCTVDPFIVVAKRPASYTR